MVEGLSQSRAAQEDVFVDGGCAPLGELDLTRTVLVYELEYFVHLLLDIGNTHFAESCCHFLFVDGTGEVLVNPIKNFLQSSLLLIRHQILDHESHDGPLKFATVETKDILHELLVLDILQPSLLETKLLLQFFEPGVVAASPNRNPLLSPRLEHLHEQVYHVFVLLLPKIAITA